MVQRLLTLGGGGAQLPPDLVGRIGHADGRLTVRGALTTAERLASGGKA